MNKQIITAVDAPEAGLPEDEKAGEALREGGIMTRRYAVKTRFVFTGTFFITAGNKDEAKEYVEKHCGPVLGRGIHTALPDEDADWDFPVHPEKDICQVNLNNRRNQER